ncbi:MAG: metallophosphoesterase [Halioglobus sp.]
MNTLLRRLAPHLLSVTIAGVALTGCAPGGDTFTIAVIPDTQNMLDFTHQKAEGFAINSSALFIEEMEYIANNAVSNDGDIAFVASVGDVWQHQTLAMDQDHRARGFKIIDNALFAREILVTDKTTTVEMPTALAGYELLAATGIPFGVVPGNHDYDAMWSDSSFPPDYSRVGELVRPGGGLGHYDPDILGMLHIGGLKNFNSVFGSDTAFFKDKDWYVSSYNGGADSAQVFSAGGYTFLNIGLEMQPSDAVLAWAQSVVDAHPGLPTIVTTHDYIDQHGERVPNPIIDLTRVDPSTHNSAEDMWSDFISRNDQIFMVLCGHEHGQALRVDDNAAGHKVYQVLADYQDRGQAGLDAGQPRTADGRIYPIGDGWFRLMAFDTAAAVPTVRVKTYSPHYDAFSDDLTTYAQWYKDIEQPAMTDQQFYQADSYTIDMDDFRARFGSPRPSFDLFHWLKSLTSPG